MKPHNFGSEDPRLEKAELMFRIHPLADDVLLIERPSDSLEYSKRFDLRIGPVWDKQDKTALGPLSIRDVQCDRDEIFSVQKGIGSYDLSRFFLICKILGENPSTCLSSEHKSPAQLLALLKPDTSYGESELLLQDYLYRAMVPLVKNNQMMFEICYSLASNSDIDISGLFNPLKKKKGKGGQ